MVKVLVVCQRRATMDSREENDVRVTTQTINECISKYLEVPVEALEVSYIRGGDKSPLDEVDYHFDLSSSGEGGTFVANHQKYYDVVFLNTCPLGSMYDTPSLIKEIIKDDGTLFIGAISGHQVSTANLRLQMDKNQYLSYIESEGFYEKHKQWNPEDNKFRYIYVYSLDPLSVAPPPSLYLPRPPRPPPPQLPPLPIPEEKIKTLVIYGPGPLGRNDLLFKDFTLKDYLYFLYKADPAAIRIPNINEYMDISSLKDGPLDQQTNINYNFSLLDTQGIEFVNNHKHSYDVILLNGFLDNNDISNLLPPIKEILKRDGTLIISFMAHYVSTPGFDFNSATEGLRGINDFEEIYREEGFAYYYYKLRPDSGVRGGRSRRIRHRRRRSTKRRRLSNRKHSRKNRRHR